MKRPILCATDLGNSGFTALAWAAAWSRSTGAPVTLLHVDAGHAKALGVPHAILPAAMAMIERMKNRTERHEAKLEQTRQSLDIACSLKVGSGHPWEAILNAAEEIEASLIVVGPHQHGVGSTARRVVTHAERPVLVARGQAPQRLDELNWIVGVPDTSGDAPLIQHVSKMANAFHGRVKLVRALPQMIGDPFGTPGPISHDPAALQQVVEDHMNKTAASLAGSVSIHVAYGDPARVLDEVASEGDVIAVAAHDRGVVERFFLGSVTERLLRITEKTVYVEHAQSAET